AVVPLPARAVPAAAVELIGEQAPDETVDVRTEVGADRERPAVDARLDLPVGDRLAVVLPVTVLCDQLGRLAGSLRGRVEAQVAQQHQRGQGRGPRLTVGGVRLDAGPPALGHGPAEAG